MRNGLVVGALLQVLLTASLASPAQAETGMVRVVFTKGGFIVGVGDGKGVLTVRGHHYPFRISGLSVGFTVGASIARLRGQALNLIRPSDIQGTYGAIGVGGALAAGIGSVRLRNERGVILQFDGGKVGVELSAAVARATVTLL